MFWIKESNFVIEGILSKIQLGAKFVALALLLVITTGCNSEAVDELEIRFSQGTHLFSGPSREPGRGYEGGLAFTDLMLQNFSVVNKSETPIEVKEINMSLYKGDVLVQRQAVDLGDTARVLGKIQKFIEFNFKAGLDVAFGADKIIREGEKISNSMNITKDQAIIITDNMFLVKGTVDRIVVDVKAETAGGKIVTVSNNIEVKNELTKNDYIFPLETADWYVYSNVDPHGHHRFTQNSEFAIDAAMLGEGGKLYKTDGMTWEDWYGYNKKVLAAADGKVVVSSDNVDFPLKPLMRQADENWRQYTGRIGQRMMGLFMKPDVNIYEAAGGNHIIIEHANGEYTWYMHLAKNQNKVKVGDLVKQGDHIAGVGGTGESPSVHLHFQITDGTEFNSHAKPYQFIDQIPVTKILNTSKPVDAGRFVWLQRDDFPAGN